MANERWLWAMLLWAVAGLGCFACRRRSPVFLPTLAFVGTALNGSFYAIATLFVEPSSWRNLAHMSDEMFVATQKEYLAFALGLAAAAWIATNFGPRRAERAVRLRTDESQQLTARDFVISCALVLVGGALYAIYVKSVGMSALSNREDYAEKYLLGQGLGPLQLGLWMAIAGCLWAEASPLARAEKQVFRAVALAIAAWSLAVISVRTNLAILALGYLVITCRARGWELRRVRPALVVVLAALYLLLETFSLFRSTYRGDVGEALWLIQARGAESLSAAVGGSELSHPFITASEVFAAREPAELAGKSLVDGVLAFVPRGLYPDRPPMLAEQFVRTNYMDLASRGGGAAFSLVAEGWLNFGSLIGPWLFGCAMGLLLFWVERRCELVPHGLVARLAPYFAFYVAVQHRNEFASLAKQVFILGGVVTPFWLLGLAVAGVLTGRTLMRSPQTQ